ncbi:hypothetical protein HFD88_009005 [Aspergillus terreus]|nr:hypothetical protein HFD88_009005 [Aspergillus terreus]
MMRLEPDTHQVEIEDIRGHESEFNLDTHGFAFYSHVSKYIPPEDESTIRNEIYAETAEMLKEITGATRVHVFSHLLRRADSKDMAKWAASTTAKRVADAVPPARVVHIDQSESGAHTILRQNLGEEADRLQKTRWALINVWRPLEPIRRDPLALCDARTADDKDLVCLVARLPAEPTGDNKYNDLTKGRAFDMYRVLYSEHHRWYYASDMVPEEVLLLKIFDSKDDVAKRTPHSAFEDPSLDPTAGTRKSMEIRCLVFWEDTEA